VTRKNSKEETLKGAEDPHHSGPPSKETEEVREALKQLCNAVHEQNSLPIVTECAEMESNVARLVEDNSSTVQETAHWNEAKKSVTSQTEELKDEMGRLPEEVKENNVISSKYAAVEGQISSAIQQSESLKQEKEVMASEIQKLQDEQEETCKSNMEAKALRTLYDNTIDRMPELEQKLSNAIRERDSLKEAMVSLTSVTQKLKAENKRLLEGLDETESIVTECDYVKYKITKLEENSNAIQETESLNKAKKDLESQIEKLKDEQKGLLKRNMEKAKALRAEHYNMRHRMLELEEELSNAVQKRDCLLEAKASLTSEMGA
jgi:chromosome segregation ATPase